MSKFRQCRCVWFGSIFSTLLAVAPSLFAAVVDLAPGDLYPSSSTYTVLTVTRTHAQYEGLYEGGLSNQARTLDVEETNMNLTFFGTRGVERSFFLSAGVTHLSLRDRKNGLKASGLGDVQIGTGVWLFNNNKTGQAAGIGMSATFPTGEYTSTQPLNPGENRQRYNVLGRYRSPNFGAYWLDLMAQRNWLSDNTNFRGRTLSTQPSQAFTAYVAKRLNTYGSIYLGYERSWGGKSYLDSQKLSSGQKDTRIQMGWRHPISRDSELVIRASESLRVINGYDQKRRLSLSINRRL